MAVSRRRFTFVRVVVAALILGSFGVPLTQSAAAATGCGLTGYGTQASPYLVSTVAHLGEVGTSCGLAAHYRQMADIVLPGVTSNHSPIGNANTAFTGVYDGGGHTIGNVRLENAVANQPVGFFGVVGDNDHPGRVENVHLPDATFSFPDDRAVQFVGGLVASFNNGAIRNSSVTNVDIRVLDTVPSSLRIGGLVGSMSGGTTIEGSWSSGIVYVAGAGNDQGEWVGGLVGFQQGGASAISNSYSTATVSGRESVGGLVGEAWGSVTRSFSTGQVTGTLSVGGLLGRRANPPTTESFWDTQTSTQATSAGGTGKNTADMKTLQTFSEAGWNIVGGWEAFEAGTSEWGICSAVNDGYPFLLWQLTAQEADDLPCVAAGTGGGGTGGGGTGGGGTGGGGGQIPPPVVIAPAPVLSEGVLPTVTPGQGVWQQANGTIVPLTVISPAPSQLQFIADDVSVRVIAGDGTSPTAGVQVSEDAVVTCEICAALTPGSSVFVWLFSTPQLLATLNATGAPCMTFDVSLNGATPGDHTMQLAFTTAGGVQAVNFGLSIVDPSLTATDETKPPVPTGIPAGEGAAPTAPIALLVALIVGLCAVARRFTATNRG